MKDKTITAIEVATYSLVLAIPALLLAVDALRFFGILPD